MPPRAPPRNPSLFTRCSDETPGEGPIGSIVVAVASTWSATEPSVEDLYRRYRREVLGFAYRAVGSGEAEDVTQTTFLLAHRAIGEGVEPNDPRAWLLAIARNVCRSRCRSLSRRPREEPLDETLLAAAAEGEAASQLRDAFAFLLPRQRAALVMQTIGGRSTAEIGAYFGIAPGAADALLHRARSALRDNLQTSVELTSCDDTEALVQAQLRQDLSATRQAGLRAHLRGCAPCATTARQLRARKRSGALLGLPWDLGNRLAGLLGSTSAGFKAAVVLGTLAISTTAAVDHPGQQPRPPQPQPQAGAAAARLSHAATHTTIKRTFRRVTVGSTGIRRLARERVVPPVRGIDTNPKQETKPPATTTPAPRPITIGQGPRTLTTSSGPTTGNASIAVEISLDPTEPAAGVDIHSDLLDTDAHLATDLSTTKLAISTDIAAAGAAQVNLDLTAAAEMSATATGADGHVSAGIELPVLTGLDQPKQPGSVLGLPIGGQLP
jgi:RNA polymerase sigma factor (sigma-70 family)